MGFKLQGCTPENSTLKKLKPRTGWWHYAVNSPTLDEKLGHKGWVRSRPIEQPLKMFIICCPKSSAMGTCVLELYDFGQLRWAFCSCSHLKIWEHLQINTGLNLQEEPRIVLDIQDVLGACQIQRFFSIMASLPSLYIQVFFGSPSANVILLFLSVQFHCYCQLYQHLGCWRRVK